MSKDPEREEIREVLNKYSTLAKFLYRVRNYPYYKVMDILTLGKRTYGKKEAEELHKFTGGKSGKRGKGPYKKRRWS